MKDFIKHFRLGPLHLYVTTRRLKNPGRGERLRHNAKPKIDMLKRCRYRMNGGCCEVCGRRFRIKQLEMHHIESVKNHPELIARDGNLLMVCRTCHMQLHQKPNANTQPVAEKGGPNETK